MSKRSMKISAKAKHRGFAKLLAYLQIFQVDPQHTAASSLPEELELEELSTTANSTMSNKPARQACNATKEGIQSEDSTVSPYGSSLSCSSDRTSPSDDSPLTCTSDDGALMCQPANSKQISNDYSPHNGDSVPQRVDNSFNNRRTADLYIKAETANLNILIAVDINGERIPALIDTGAYRCIMRSSVAKLLNLRPRGRRRSYKLMGLENGLLEIIGTVTARMTIKSFTYSVKFEVAEDLSDELVLGIRFMKRHRQAIFLFEGTASDLTVQQHMFAKTCVGCGNVQISSADERSQTICHRCFCDKYLSPPTLLKTLPGCPIIPVIICKGRFMAIVDSGASHNFMPSSVAASLGLIPKGPKSLAKLLSAKCYLTVRGCVAVRMTIHSQSRVDYDKVVFSVVDTSTELILGLQLLKQHRRVVMTFGGGASSVYV